MSAAASAAAAASTATAAWGQWWAAPAARAALLRAFEAREGLESLYVYSVGEVERCVAHLQEHLPARLFYAIKANPHPAVMRAVHDRGLGFECVSLAEVEHVRALFPRLDAQRILFTPNFAPRCEYEAAFRLGVHVTVDNLWVLEAWPHIFREGRRILIRVDPGGEGKGHHKHVKTAGPGSKFGVTVDDLLAAAPSIAPTVVGLHVHAGSGILDDPDNWASNVRFLGRLLGAFPHVRHLNIGGGLGTPYRPGDEPLDVAAVGERMRRALADIQPAEAEAEEASGPLLEIWMEPGRYVAASCGVLLTPVTQVKRKPQGKSFVGVLTGMNSLIRPALYDAYHPIVNLSRRVKRLLVVEGGAEEEADEVEEEGGVMLADVVGPICETGDILGVDRELPAATDEGDCILVGFCGAYGRCMSSSYNMRPPAEEIVFP